MQAAVSPTYVKTKTPSGAVILSFRHNHLAEKAGQDGPSFDRIQKKLSSVFNQHSAHFYGRAEMAVKSMEKILNAMSEVPEKNRLDVLKISAEKYLGYVRDNGGLFACSLAESTATRCLDFIYLLEKADAKSLNLIRSYTGCIALCLSEGGKSAKDCPDLMAACTNINRACTAYLRDAHKQSLH